MGIQRTMKKHTSSLMYAVAAIVLMMVFAGCANEKKTNDEANELMNAAYKAKDYERLMTLADSLESKGALIPVSADYWRGYACDRLKRKDEAEKYWRKVMDDVDKLTDAEEWDAYARSASRLVNLLCVRGDYDEALQTAQPVIARLEAMKCDTTSDYVNLLIYTGLCQSANSQGEDESLTGFLRAIDKHRENIERNHSDEAYKDAIAGQINIAYYCMKAGNPQAALLYTRNFGSLLMEYEHRPGVDTNYVDRQAGRYTLYKAWALKELGRKAEADEMFKAFKKTRYSQEPEGMSMAANYRDDIDETDYSEEP
jgi:tetratricopeptide (TPR) repeat protein